MSEVLEGGGMTAGALLRDARQAAGVHIAALAVALKVPVNKLEALEADNYQALPDTVFVRALASSMCRTLKIDPGPVLALLPQNKNPRLSTDGGGLNAPVKGPVGKSSSSFSPRPTARPVTLVVLALLVGALVLVFLPGRSNDATDSRVIISPSQAPGTGATVPSAEPASPAVPERQDVPTAGAATAAAASSPVDGRAEALGAAPVALGTSAAASPLPGASAAAAPDGLLVLRARGESWVQVRGASGAVVLQRNLSTGETVAIPGPAPLAVVVGRADMTEVIVRGKAFDLNTVSRENVARFEVK